MGSKQPQYPPPRSDWRERPATLLTESQLASLVDELREKIRALEKSERGSTELIRMYSRDRRQQKQRVAELEAENSVLEHQLNEVCEAANDAATQRSGNAKAKLAMGEKLAAVEESLITTAYEMRDNAENWEIVRPYVANIVNIQQCVDLLDEFFGYVPQGSEGK